VCCNEVGWAGKVAWRRWFGRGVDACWQARAGRLVGGVLRGEGKSAGRERRPSAIRTTGAMGLALTPSAVYGRESPSTALAAAPEEYGDNSVSEHLVRQ